MLPKTPIALILATDPDREGEAISWHVLEVLKQKKALNGQPIDRVVFNAITKQAVTEAMAHPRRIDQALVDAYLARRALDYLVGFTISPVLWRKLPGARSAGRVQSVALRLVCDREAGNRKVLSARNTGRSIATLATPRSDTFEARLVGADGKKLQRLDIGSGAEAEAFKQALETAAFTVASVEAKPVKRHPQPPFTTSTLQQEASRKLGFAPAHTMRVAQRLYEGIEIGGETVGLITYMRTDGVQIADEAIAAVRRVIEADYGARYVPHAPRRYETKAKNAQEAHEAIRPTELTRRPSEAKSFLDADQARLYELIWLRTVASQMESAELERTTVDITAKVASRLLELRATGTVVKFDGFLTLYQEGQDEDADDEESRRLPPMSAGEPLTKRSIAGDQHFTEPPPRYSEASLVKRMEELGIGRPSTYASIMQVLKDRKYVRLDKRRLYPGGSRPHRRRFPRKLFRQIRRVRFHRGSRGAARSHLQQRGGVARRAARFLARFHRRGRRDQGSENLAGDRCARRTARAAPVPAERRRQRSAAMSGLQRRPADAQALQVRRLHRLLELSRMPLYPPADDAGRRLGPTSAPRNSAKIPRPALKSRCAAGRFGPYVQLGEAVEGEKPKRAGLPKGTAPDDVDLERALALLSLPREVGRHPEDGEPIRAGIGRFGPYVQHGKTYANLEPGDEVFHIGLNRAVTLIAEKIAKGPRAPLRRRPRPPARRPSDQRRADHRQERPLRALCQPRRRQRHAAGRQDAGDALRLKRLPRSSTPEPSATAPPRTRGRARRSALRRHRAAHQGFVQKAGRTSRQAARNQQTTDARPPKLPNKPKRRARPRIRPMSGP